MKKRSKWAQEIMQKDFVVLDSETTGLNDARFVQLAIIDKHGKTLFNELINPGVKIEDGAKAVHGITEEMVTGEKPFIHYQHQILEILTGKTIIIYNADFDMSILNHELSSDIIIYDFISDYHCVMKEYAKYHGEKSHRGGYKWQSLTNACIQMGIEIKNAHNALGDCLMTLALIKAMAGHEEKPETSEIEALLNRAFAEYGRCEMFVTDIYFIFLTIPNCEVFGRKQKGVITIRENGLTVYNSQEKIYTTGKWEKLIKVMLE